MAMSNKHLTDVLDELVRFPSVSSTSNVAVSECVKGRLESLGFEVESADYFDPAGIRKMNLVACRNPLGPRGEHLRNAAPGLAYFCHTDVVPVTHWTGPTDEPFRAVVANDRVYGRGSCDMKGSLVAMLHAAQQVTASEQTAPLWIVCTADEEVGFEGANHLVNHSAAYRAIVNAQPLSIIGEPTGLRVVHAHKGITAFSITSQGKAAHSSTDDGVNANIAMLPMLELMRQIWQQTLTDAEIKDERFDPSHLSWNFGISDGCTALNVTPARSVAWCCFRTMPDIDGAALMKRVSDAAQELGLEFKMFKGGKPVWISPDAECIRRMCDLAGGPAMTVCYGTDAGEFHELKQRVIFGPGDIAQAHTTDEWISLEQLTRGADCYANAVRRWCVDTRG